MEVFGNEIRENWFDSEYHHAGYHFKEVHREEEFIVFKAEDHHFEVFRRRSSDSLRNYRPNKSNWGSYAWTCMSLELSMRKIESIKFINR